MNLTRLICPLESGGFLPERLESVLRHAVTAGERTQMITTTEEFVPIKGERILFLVGLGEDGLNLEHYRMMQKMRQPGFLQDCIGGVIIDGSGELYTKSTARELVLTANMAGCTFPGKPLVEATGSLRNFQVQARLLNTDRMGAYQAAAADLAERVRRFVGPYKKNPRLLALHASDFHVSNTWNLWEMVKPYLTGVEVEELSLRNGEISDCTGCPYTMCMHFSDKGKCYYGGTMIEHVNPAVERCDGLILLCPNYNDAVSANISAFINRLTALYRKTPFYDKYLFGIVVSGYSGGDLVAMQLISSLNLNKAFILPADFAMIETANDPGSIRAVPAIEERAAIFGNHIRNTLTGKILGTSN